MRRLWMNSHKILPGIPIKTKIWGKMGDTTLAGRYMLALI